MIPEGLQYSSIADIVTKVKSIGMNSLRMGWAVEMIDDILDNGGDVTIHDALIKSLGPENGTKITTQIIQHNPIFTPNTTRLEVWDAVAAELDRQQINMIVNNHVSKAKWCCSVGDGNGWFGDTYFDVDKWKRALNFMAEHMKKWPAATAISLRNELRQTNNPAVDATYGWSVWYDQMTDAAAAIHAVNPDTLIIFSGLNYDHDLSVPVAGSTLNGTTDSRTFDLGSISYRNKFVWELHSYDNSETNYTKLQSEYYNRGFSALDTSSSTTAKTIAPVLLTEFGFAQNGTDYPKTGSDYLTVYAQALKDFVTGDNRVAEAARIEGSIGWLEWSLGGSYYTREGIQDHDDWWALLNHDWSGWRNETVLQAYQIPMIEATLANKPL
ncbi:cellulase family protein [Diaporthe sp. PMI_573]|nr:cellulase family protein [Diaporthaceae sp. PMI_573]